MEQYIKKILSSRVHSVLDDENMAPSAVLLLMLCQGEEYQVLLTKRSLSVAHHKGEISFPGGTRDPEDRDLLHTAFREGEEEIGVKPEDVRLLGRLDDVSTTSTGFAIATFVGAIPNPYSFHVNEDEIADLLIVPLRTLCRQYRALAAEQRREYFNESDSPFRHEEHVIWGATARILRQFLDLVCHMMP